MWVAPRSGRQQGQWIAQESRSGGGALKWVLLAGGALVALMVVGAVATFLLWSGSDSGSRSSGEVAVTQDMPLALGDDVTVYTKPNSSCSSYIAALLDGGRVLVDGCGGGNSGLPADRSLLTLSTFAFATPAPDDVALEKTAAGWSRVVVVGLEAGNHVRVEPLLGGTAKSVDPKALCRVWHTSSAAGLHWVKFPTDAPLSVDDVVDYHDGAFIKSGKVTHIAGKEVELLPAHRDKQGQLEPDKGAAPARHARNTLVVRLGSPLSPPKASEPLLARKGGKWRRAKLVSTGEHGRWTVQDDGGAKWVVWGGHVLRLPHG